MSVLLTYRTDRVLSGVNVTNNKTTRVSSMDPRVQDKPVPGETVETNLRFNVPAGSVFPTRTPWKIYL